MQLDDRDKSDKLVLSKLNLFLYTLLASALLYKL
jgi:hypothetical protein